MKSGHGLTVDGFSEPAPADLGLASRHVPGLSDELGDRVLILDDRGEPSLELLRFRRTLTTFPGFEVALRRRAERLRQFRHPAFGATPAVEYLGEDRGLVLLSSYTPERRLSEVLEYAQGPAFASSLIHQLTPGLAVLHQYGEGLGHGALTASRIVISPEGQLVIVEHVLGSALERLNLTATRMHLELGIPVPATELTNPRIDSRTDFFQLGLIALSLLLGRPLDSEEYPANLDRVLDQVLRTPDRESAEQFRGLRVWLERALQLNGRAFPSSEDAKAALRDVPEQVTDAAAQRWRELLSIRPAFISSSLEEVRLEEVLLDVPLESEVLPDDSAPVVSAELSDELPATALVVIPAPPAVLSTTPADAIEDSEDLKEQTMDQPRALWSASQASVQPHTSSSRSSRGFLLKLKPQDYLKLAVATLALCAIAEAVVIGILLRRRSNVPPPVTTTQVNLETPDPGASVMVDGRPAGVTPLQLTIGPDMRSISVVPPPKQELIVGSTGQQGTLPQTPAVAAGARSVNAPAPVPAPQRSGGIRLSSPIELEVFEGDTRLGSSATGIVSASAGRHELDLVNSVLGFRSRQVVDIKDGQVLLLNVSPPNGRININAVPWAEVLIDGKAVGETPIGNLSISLGEHEIVFRHPQLGEMRQTALVRSDAITRVTANLQR